jgi:hypothetical protein
MLDMKCTVTLFSAETLKQYYKTVQKLSLNIHYETDHNVISKNIKYSFIHSLLEIGSTAHSDTTCVLVHKFHFPHYLSSSNQIIKLLAPTKANDFIFHLILALSQSKLCSAVNVQPFDTAVV